MNKILVAVLLGGTLLAAPAAFADEARDTLLKTEAQIEALDSADAAMAASVDYQETQLRLQEARDAEEKGHDEESIWRSQEAALHGEIVKEKVKLHALERTVTEIKTGIETLRRELVS
ncbi:hypothetical protein [Hyphomonas sp.]|uniref:hypothetical protein n=1 Tax=Hyphomonas sp. TaxID=87 RepID=UPI0032ED528C